MKWTGIYRPPAQDELANIWLSAADPQAVANAADEIDRALSRNPLEAGESLAATVHESSSNGR